MDGLTPVTLNTTKPKDTSVNNDIAGGSGIMGQRFAVDVNKLNGDSNFQFDPTKNPVAPPQIQQDATKVTLQIPPDAAKGTNVLTSA